MPTGVRMESDVDIVLVHGAGTGGWLWDDVDEVGELVEWIDPGVVLVGFSYGGLVAGVAAARMPDRVHRLVYVDAFVPQPGRSLFDALPPPVADQMRQLADEVGDGWKLPPAPVELLGGLGRVRENIDVTRLDTLLSRRGPHPLGTYQEPAPDLVPFPVERTRHISCTDKHPGDPMVAIAAAVHSAGVPVQEVQAGHFALLIVPDEVAAEVLAATQ